MRGATISVVVGILTLSACAQTDVQQMSRDTFKVQTHASDVCGPTGTRNVAFKAAAVEVIRKGGDKFIIVGDQSGMDGWSGIHSQGMIVRMIPEGSPEARNALSARETLGSGWRTAVEKGVPVTCTA